MSPLTEPTRLTLAKGQPVLNDSYLYTNTVLLLHGDGANGSTNIVDSSRVAGSPKIVTPVGNAQISTAVVDPFGNSTGVLAFDGTGDYLSTPNNDAWDFPNDFTIEAWVYLTAYSSSYAGFYGATVAANYSGSSGIDKGWQVRVNGTASSYNSIYVYTGLIDFTFAATVSLNVWTHIAVTRNGSSVRAFVNGTQVGSTVTNTDTFTENGTRSLWIGGLNDSTYRFWLPGYIDDFRITKGIARYTSNFTPPTAPFPDF